MHVRETFGRFELFILLQFPTNSSVSVCRSFRKEAEHRLRVCPQTSRNMSETGSFSPAEGFLNPGLASVNRQSLLPRAVLAASTSTPAENLTSP